MFVKAAAASLLLAVAAPALADDVVAESDTGMVFADLDCQITDADVGEPHFTNDMFDYLSVTVDVNTTCVDHEGRTWHGGGMDTMIFPTPTFDWATQSWIVNGQTLAWKRNGFQIEVNEDLDVSVWNYVDETHVAFKVQFKVPPSL